VPWEATKVEEMDNAQQYKKLDKIESKEKEAIE
jgi:hypothetical protein